MSNPEGSDIEAEDVRRLIPMMVAATATWTISLMSYYAQAQLFGPIMEEFEQGEAAVGWLFSLENAALALSTLAAAGPLARWSRTATAMAGTGLLVAANVASAFTSHYEALLFLRFAVGVGAGLTGAAGTAAAAGSRDPQRVYAVVTVAWGLLAAAVPTLLAYAIEPFGSRGGFLLLAGLSVLLSPTFLWLLPPKHNGEERFSLLGAPNRMLALVMMSGLLIFESGQGAVYTFIAQLGEAAGLDGYEIGSAMSVTGLAGLLGGVVAAGVGSRFGQKWPIAIGLVLNAAAATGLALLHDATAYLALLLLWNIAYTFVVPYLMGAMAELDDLGRWVVASDGAWTLGSAVGPGVAGTLVEYAGYPPLALLSVVTASFCVAAAFFVMRRIEAPADDPEGGGHGVVAG